MTNLFVTNEIALQLKEKGFKEDCFGYYQKERLIVAVLFEVGIDWGKNTTPAPFYQQAVDWLRDNKNLFIVISRIGVGNQQYEFCWDITKITESPNRKTACSGIETPDTYKSYYEALNVAIQEALKLI